MSMEGLQIAHFCVDGAIAFFLFWLRGKAKKIDDLEEKLNKASDEKISTRFKSIEEIVTGHALRLTTAMDELKERLKEGEDEFDALGDGDHKIELKLANQTGEIKEYLRLALGEHEAKVSEKFERVNREMGEIKGDVKALSREVERRRGN